MYKEHQIKKKYFSIGEVSKMLELPESKIRFWTEELGIRVTRKVNVKRLFTQRFPPERVIPSRWVVIKGRSEVL